jgi:hypothetical protein
MGVEFSDAGSEGTANHPKLPKGLERLWQKTDDIQPHHRHTITGPRQAAD